MQSNVFFILVKLNIHLKKKKKKECLKKFWSKRNWEQMELLDLFCKCYQIMLCYQSVKLICLFNHVSLKTWFSLTLDYSPKYSKIFPSYLMVTNKYLISYWCQKSPFYWISCSWWNTFVLCNSYFHMLVGFTYLRSCAVLTQTFIKFD